MGGFPATKTSRKRISFFAAIRGVGAFDSTSGRSIDVAAVNTYSWHPNTRAPQVYRVYASDGTDPNFNPTPGVKVDLSTCGWREIAFVDTRPKEGDDGGQYGVSIADTSGSLGRYRYLLFDVFETESDDPWGQTFYSEIDVVKK